jgi:hypothetical protein
MDYYIKAIIVDDDSRYTKTLQDRVYLENQIELTSFQSWEEAKTEIWEHSNKYSAIILDALGKINSGDKGENPKRLMTSLNQS